MTESESGGSGASPSGLFVNFLGLEAPSTDEEVIQAWSPLIDFQEEQVARGIKRDFDCSLSNGDPVSSVEDFSMFGLTDRTDLSRLVIRPPTPPVGAAARLMHAHHELKAFV